MTTTIVVTGPPISSRGGPGADLLDARLAPRMRHLVPRPHGRGHGPPERPRRTTARRARATTCSARSAASREARATTGWRLDRTRPGLPVGAGDDTLVGSPRASAAGAGAATTTSSRRVADDASSGGAGADRLSGGPGRDEASYARPRAAFGSASATGRTTAPRARATTSARTSRTLTGGARARHPHRRRRCQPADRATAARTCVRGAAGPDELIGWGDGDVLDAGHAARDRVKAGRARPSRCSPTARSTGPIATPARQ